MSSESSVDMLRTQKPDTFVHNEEYRRQGKALDAGVLQTKGISDTHDNDINRHDKSSSLRNVNNVQEFIEHLASDVNNNKYSGMFPYSSEKRRQRERKCKDRVHNYSENYYDNMLQAQARLLFSENLKPKCPVNITESGGPQTFAKRKILSVAPCEYGPYTTSRNSYIDSGSVQYSMGKSGLSGVGVYTGSEAGTGAYSRLGVGSPWGIEPTPTVRSGVDTQWQRKETHHGEAGNIQAQVPRHLMQDPKRTEGSEVDIQWKRQMLDHQDASILRGQAPSLLRKAPSPQLLSPSLLRQTHSPQLLSHSLRQAPSSQLLSPCLQQQNPSHQLLASSLQQQAPSLHLLSPSLQWQAPRLGRLTPSCTVGSGVDIEWQEAVNNRGAADVVDVNNNPGGGSYTNPTIYKPRFNGTSYSAPVTPTQGTPTRGTNLSDGEFQLLDFNKNLIGSPAISQPTGQARRKRPSPLAKGVVPLKKRFEDKTGLCRENTGKTSPGRMEKGKTSPVEADKGKTSPGEDENGRTSPNKAGMGETATIHKKGRRKTSTPDEEGRYPCKTCHRRFKKPYLYTHQKVVHARKQWVYVPSLAAKAKPAKK
ncbi:uncharacterized protein LOC128222831 isoform X2 [Mya arenaria]|uniref:uncharacterized protein LOC128222831 isoform X2 n=1 Tax=Mya arenaria TaxID=6604 RepID=UPI0022E9638C|nr:uncharacterized protein LOC128222831 isoform X2 [Mya arenaria]